MGGGRVNAPSRFRLRLAARALKAGRSLAYPTEGVFGLGCDPRNERAVRALLNLKGRPSNKGLILIAADLAQLEPYIAPLAPAQRQILEATWPGPVTWILPARPQTPTWLRGEHAALAARVTAHGPSAALCRAFGGALVSTSANPAGRPPAKTRLKVRRYFPKADIGHLPGATGGLNRPTAIYDLLTGAKLR
jgi:L-threonylcarbamoyladenylate synthase